MARRTIAGVAETERANGKPKAMGGGSTLGTSIQDDIETLILSGELREGERLNEAHLAERFGVSRAPVREALRSLSQLGLVVIVPNSGASVRSVSLRETLELYEIRAGLARAAGRALAWRITPNDIDSLRAIYDDMAAACKALESLAYFDMNFLFHARLMELTGNKRLAELDGSITKELYLFLRRSVLGPERLRYANVQHAKILEALKKGGETRIANALERDILESKKNLLRTLGG
jgi:DNA-binding GntR family transcriptional regulator